MPLAIAGMSPLLLDTTKLAIQDLEFTPDIVSNPFRHSGNEFPSVGVLPGGRPAMRFKTPFVAAFNYISLKAKLATAAEIYFATFANGLRQSGANHAKLSLNTSAKAFNWISGASVRQNGLLMADVTTMFLSSDGVANPLVYSASGNTLPVLSAEPQLNTLGPIGRNGTRKDGAANLGFANNCIIVSPVNDGDKFPKTATLFGAEPKFMVEHQDPMLMLTDLGLEGEAITSMALFFAGIDPNNGRRQTTGVSLTATLGHRYPGSFKWALNDPASVGIVADLLSIDGTHPIAVNTAATLP